MSAIDMTPEWVRETLAAAGVDTAGLRISPAVRISSRDSDLVDRVEDVLDEAIAGSGAMTLWMSNAVILIKVVER